MPKESLEIDTELYCNVKCLVNKEVRFCEMSSLVHYERGTNEAPAGDWRSEVTQRPITSSFSNYCFSFTVYCFPNSGVSIILKYVP